jgi:hypothetical protein
MAVVGDLRPPVELPVHQGRSMADRGTRGARKLRPFPLVLEVDCKGGCLAGGGGSRRCSPEGGGGGNGGTGRGIGAGGLGRKKTMSLFSFFHCRIFFVDIFYIL